MINFTFPELILYAKNYNFINIEIDNFNCKLNKLDIKFITDYNFSNSKVIFLNLNNDLLSVKFYNKEIIRIEYYYSITNSLEPYKIYFYSYYNKNYKDFESKITREDLVTKECKILFEENSFYTIEELLKIQKNLIFL